MPDVPTIEHLAGAGIDPDDIKRACCSVDSRVTSPTTR